MKHPDFNTVQYVKVSDSPHHIEALYELLKQRKHGISHRKLPDFEEHSLFVINHPYRAWYLIEADGVCVGSVYVQNDNSISVDYAENYVALLSHTIEFIRKDHDPLPGIKSVRASNFFINVAPDNSNLIAELLRCGAKHIQSSFALSP